MRGRGNSRFLIDTLESLSWLCAAIRKPNKEVLQLSSAEMSDDSLVKLQVHEAEADLNVQNVCWHKLFKAGSIVRSDLPMKNRGKGLGMSFDDMASLAAAVLVVEINGVPLLLGQSTLLIPVARLETGIQWHLETWESGLLDPTKGQSLVPILKRHPQTLKADFEVLREEKAFLGWSSSETPIQVVVGTEQARASCNLVKGSGADRARPNVAEGTDEDMNCELKFKFLVLKKGRKIRWGQFNVQTLSFTVGNAFEMVLDSPGDKSVAIYDTATKRGWLLRRLDVLLYMIHVRLREQQNNPIGCSTAQQSARDVLELHRDSNIRGLTLQEYILGLSTGLDALTNSLRQHVRRDASTLIGVELFDLAFSQQGGPLELKRITLGKSSGHWGRLVDYSWVLFCAGMGEAMRPANQGNAATCIDKSVRVGHDYLAAVIPCLKYLATSTGGDWDMGSLGNGTFVTRAAKVNDCGSDHCCCFQLRQLTKKEEPHDIYNDNCATVFGVIP